MDNLFTDQIMAKATAATTKNVEITRDMCPCTFTADGVMAGAEAITVLQYQSDGTYVNIAESGADVVIDVDQNYWSVYAPCKIQFSKSITANAVGIIWHRG